MVGRKQGNDFPAAVLALGDGILPGQFQTTLDGFRATRGKKYPVQPRRHHRCCQRGQIFRRIVLPLSFPALASFAIFQFLWVWNDYLVALVFLGDQNRVMTMALAALVGEKGQDWHLLTSGAFVSMLLPLAVFFALQRYFVRGLLAGSVKG